MSSCKSAPLRICISPDQHFSRVIFVLEARAFPAPGESSLKRQPRWAPLWSTLFSGETSKGFAPGYLRIWRALFERADTVSSVSQDQIRDFVASYLSSVKWIRCCVDDKRFKTLKCKDVVDMHHWGDMQLPSKYICISRCLHYVTREPPSKLQQGDLQGLDRSLQWAPQAWISPVHTDLIPPSRAVTR